MELVLQYLVLSMPDLAKKVRASGRSDVIKIWSRRSTILPNFVELTFGVHNERKFILVSV